MSEQSSASSQLSELKLGSTKWFIQLKLPIKRLFPHTTVIYCALNSVTDSPKHDKKTRKKLPARIFLQGRWLISQTLRFVYEYWNRKDWVIRNYFFLKFFFQLKVLNMIFIKTSRIRIGTGTVWPPKSKVKFNSAPWPHPLFEDTEWGVSSPKYAPFPNFVVL